jgi:hypothetical protein
MRHRGGAKVKGFLCLGVLAILVAACGGATVGGSLTDGGSSAAGNTSSGAGKASLNLTVTGDVQGTTTQLASYNCSGAQFGTFADTFKPVFNGANYDLQLLISKVTSTPVTIDIAAEGSRVLLTMYRAGAGWLVNSDTTGTITIAAGGDSGTVDAHAMSVIGLPGSRTVDMKFTFTCPYKH